MSVRSGVKISLLAREVWGSIPGRSYRRSVATAPTFLWSCVVLPLSSGDGPRHLLHASA